MAEKSSTHGGKSNRFPKGIIFVGVFVILWFCCLYFLDIPIARYWKFHPVPKWLDETVEFCSFYNKTVPLALLLISAAISLGGEKWRMLGRALLALLLTATVWGGKYFIPRTRPKWFNGMQWKDTFFKPYIKHHFEIESFPSGDAAIAFAVTFILVQYFPKHRFILYLLAVGCAASRVLFQYHYLSDVLLGAMVGYLSAKIVLYLSASSGK